MNDTFFFFLLLRFVSIKKKKKLKAIDKTLWSNIRIVRWLFYSLKKNQNMYLRVKLSFVEDSLDIIKLIGVKFIYIFILTQKPLKTRKKIFTFVHGFFFYLFNIFLQSKIMLTPLKAKKKKTKLAQRCLFVFSFFFLIVRW
jgi:hypothetical protein